MEGHLLLQDVAMRMQGMSTIPTIFPNGASHVLLKRNISTAHNNELTMWIMTMRKRQSQLFLVT